MGKLVFAMSQSLDGFVDYDRMGVPDPGLFRHWIETVRGSGACLYGRGVYELMRYWDADDAAWGPDQVEFAQAWRAKHKWVVSHSLQEVGPNATLVTDLEGAARDLKARLDGVIDVAGPVLAGSLTKLGLMDEYRIYLRPYVLGEGARFFTDPRPPLRLVSSDLVGADTVRVVYAPA